MNGNKAEGPAFLIQGKVWRYPGPAGWFFINTGLKIAEEIRLFEDLRKIGWGYIKITARVGRTQWETTLFPTQEKDFLLAIKASVRKSEGIEEGQLLEVAFNLLPPEGRPGNQVKKAGIKNVRRDPGRLS